MLRLFPRIPVNYVKTGRNVVGRLEGEGGRQTGSAEILMMAMQRTIKYDAGRVKGFGKALMSVPGCEQWESCIECRTLYCRRLANSWIRGRR